MALLTGAITALGLAGVPAAYDPNFSARTPDVPRSYVETFTQHGPHALPMSLYGAFAKSEETNLLKSVSDTLRVFVTEGTISDIDVDITDVIVPRIAESISVVAYRSVSDTIFPRITEGVTSLVKSGGPFHSVSDTIVPVIAESVSLRRLLTVSDTIIPVITDAYTALGQADELQVSDTVVPVITESYVLRQLAANVSLSVSDTINLIVTESGSVRASGDVDRIEITSRPTGRITITKR